MTTGCKAAVNQSDELRSHHLNYFNPHVCVRRDWGQLGVDPNRTGFARPVVTFMSCGHKRQRRTLDLRSEVSPMPPAGLEPATHGLRVHCSTN